MKVKNIILTTLLACMFYSSVMAMRKEGNEQRDNERICSFQEGSCNYSFEDLPIELNQTILDMLIPEIISHQEHPAFPVLCLRAFNKLKSSMQTNKTCSNKVLEYIETKIINQLIRFNRQTNSITLNHEDGKDLVAACFAFKILAGIRGRSPNFCDVQYNLVYNFLMFHGIITKQGIKQGRWNPCENTDLLGVVRSGNIINVVRAIAADANVCTTINNPGDVRHSWTVLHLVISDLRGAKYLYNIVQALVAAGADVNATIDNPECDMHGWTVLHFAINSLPVETANAIQALVIAAGADIKVIINNPGQEYHGWTVLHLATVFCLADPTTFWTLINSIPLEQRDAFINATINDPGDDFHGMTALHLAACGCFGGIHIGKSILSLIAAVPHNQRAAFVNATIDNPGQWNHDMTALQIATQKRNVCAAQLLINAGAHVPADLIPQLQEMGVNIPMENMWNQ